MQFFPGIFNIADACITVSLVALLIFFRKDLSIFIASFEKKKENATSSTD
jgi:lipoprotein signal peptidase